MSLTTEQQADLTMKLADASDKYHKLVTGRLASTVVDQNGERVTFTAANKQDLEAYIASLKEQLGMNDRANMPRALQFIF